MQWIHISLVFFFFFFPLSLASATGIFLGLLDSVSYACREITDEIRYVIEPLRDDWLSHQEVQDEDAIAGNIYTF